jgi:hypothetical protein
MFPQTIQHWYQTKYLEIYEYKLNNGKDETFWFNLILLLLKKINISLLFHILKEQFLIIFNDNDSNIFKKFIFLSLFIILSSIFLMINKFYFL